MGRADDDAIQVGLVDEQHRLDCLCDPLDRLLPDGVIMMRPPVANEPWSSMRSMSPFHSGQRSTSAQSRQTCSGRALVSMLCSTVHIAASFCV
jgi:hypothetical protein